MRSRYSAYVVGDTDYLLRTWHSTTRPKTLDLARTRWTGLDVLATTGGGLLHQEGTVHFRAHYVEGRQQGAQDENSRFLREDGLWVYLDALSD